jgi:nucleoid DNA-binding protein
MKKADIARRLARETGISRAEAADQLDRVVHDILHKLKQGLPASLPGVGTFKPDGGKTRFEQEGKGGNDPGRD